MWVERIVLYLLLPARVLTDNTGLSSVVAASTMAILLAWFFLGAQVPWKALRLTATTLLLVAMGYLYVIWFHGEYLYQIRGVIRYGTYVLLFYLFSRSRIPTREIYRVYGGLVLTEIAVSIFQRFVLGIGRPPGTLQHTNHVTYFVSFYLAISLLHYGYQARSALLFGFQLLLAGMGGTLVSLIYFFFHFRRRFGFFGYGAMAVFLLIAVFVMQDRILEVGATFGDISSRLDSANPGATSSIVWRIVTWYNMVKEMLYSGGGWMGLGLEYASLVSPYFCPASRLDPHNELVRVFLETGYIGLVLFVLGLVKLLLWLHRSEERAPLARAMKFSLLGLLAALLVGNILVQSTLLWVMAIFLGKTFQLADQPRKDTSRCMPALPPATPS